MELSNVSKKLSNVERKSHRLGFRSGSVSVVGETEVPDKGVSAMSDFEIIEVTEVEYVRRGRKSNVDPKVVDALTKLPKGKAIALTTMKQDPKSPTYATDKARIASQIRTACRMANVEGYRILWSPQGVPQVVR